MIGKVMQNSSFRATTQYVLNKQTAELLGGNMLGRNVDQLDSEFRMSRDLNPNIQRPVYHFTLSLLHSEQLSQHQWLDITSSYVQQMGLDPFENQYFVARHRDRLHEHIHIVASRINLHNGKAVPTWRERYRSQAVLRNLERDYGLAAVPCIWEVGKRAMTRAQLETMRKTGVLPVKQQLQNLIDQAAHDRPSLPELVQRLQVQGVEVRLPLTQTGKVKGISYAMQTQNGKVAMAGNDIGISYSFPGLQERLCISYDPARDYPLLQSQINWQIQEKVLASSEQLQVHADHNQCDRVTNIKQPPLYAVRSEQSQQQTAKASKTQRFLSKPSVFEPREQLLLNLVCQAQAQDPYGTETDTIAVRLGLSRGDDFAQIRYHIRQHSRLVRRWEQSDSPAMAMAKTNLYVDQLHKEVLEQTTNRQLIQNQQRENPRYHRADLGTALDYD